MMISQDVHDDQQSVQGSAGVEHSLLGDLRRLLDDPLTGARHDYLSILNRLIRVLSLQFQVACDSGYMSDVLQKFPHWGRQIEGLHTANLACIWDLDEARDRIALRVGVSSDEHRLLRRWMGSLGRMRGHETRLLQEAYLVDLGGEA